MSKLLAAKQICGVYGSDVVMIRTKQRWFDRFRSGVVDVEDMPRTYRPIVVETDKIVEIIQVDRYVSIRSIGQELRIDHKTVWNHSQKIGFQKKLDVWVPHELNLGPNQRLRYTAETERIRPIFEADGD